MKNVPPWEFLERIEAGATVIPTDKNYKAYIEDDSGHDKFYYETLSVEQQAKFIELYNEGKMKIGFPGHFYVPPFFMVFRKQNLNKETE